MTERDFHEVLSILDGAKRSVTREGEENYAAQEKNINLALKQEELDGKRQDREQRKTFATWIFWMMCAYLVVVLGIVIANGLCRLALSDTVIVTLLSTTTANVLGIFAFVAKYLFHR